MGVFKRCHLLVARLHAEEDDVSRGTGQTSFQVRLASDFFCLDIVGVQRLHRLLEQASLNLLVDTNPYRGKDRKKRLFYRASSPVCVCVCVLTLLSSSEGNLVRKRQMVPSL